MTDGTLIFEVQPQTPIVADLKKAIKGLMMYKTPHRLIKIHDPNREGKYLCDEDALEAGVTYVYEAPVSIKVTDGTVMFECEPETPIVTDVKKAINEVMMYHLPYPLIKIRDPKQQGKYLGARDTLEAGVTYVYEVPSE